MPRAKRTPTVNELIREELFQDLIVRYARSRGWKVFFFPGWAFRLGIASLRRIKRSDRLWPDKGWPDCVFMRNRKLVVAEFKTGNHGTLKAKPRPEQVEWMETLAEYGIPVYLWLPQDEQWAKDVLD